MTAAIPRLPANAMPKIQNATQATDLTERMWPAVCMSPPNPLASFRNRLSLYRSGFGNTNRIGQQEQIKLSKT